MNLGRRLILVTAFVPAVIGSLRLWRLPAFATANGAGEGIAWPASTIAVAVAVLAIIGGLFLAWRLDQRFPRLIAVVPVLATIIVVMGRRIAASGAPEEFYLVDDIKLWIVLFGIAVLLAVLVAAAPIDRRERGHSG